MKRYEFSLSSRKEIDFLDITKQINELVTKEEIKCGMVNIFIPHTTAGVTINECADPNVIYDLKFAFRKLSPKLREYLHSEGNSDAHLSSTLVGCSLNIPIENSSLLLGTWQGVFFCEFDGPRNRKVIVTIS